MENAKFENNYVATEGSVEMIEFSRYVSITLYKVNIYTQYRVWQRNLFFHNAWQSGSGSSSGVGVF